ncbi:MAG TPA: branched-chain amino acid ABC transporter permease [Acetobacteraceae bacterium]|nr:branched-chain amino acid ABC transporter permease [Acetobacteraceae bacterium]
MPSEQTMQGSPMAATGVKPGDTVSFAPAPAHEVPAASGAGPYITSTGSATPFAVAKTTYPDNTRRNISLVVLALIVAAALPTAFFNGYHLFQLTMVVVYAIGILGLSLLIGFNGQISLGHGAFFAIGAYTAAILMANWDVPYWATLPVTAIVCAIVGFLIGFPALRLEGHYLALTTFALAISVPQLLKINAVSDWTGGVQGLVLDKPDAPFGLPLTGDQWLYLFSLAVGIALYLIAWNLTRGRVGRAMMAVRDHSLAAEAMGVNLAILKTRTFAWSAMITGIAGSLQAIVVQFVAPDAYGVFISIFLFVGLVVGGVASIGGTILGALFIEFVPNVATDLSKSAPGAIYGALLIGVMFLMPQGAGGFLKSLVARARNLSRDAGEVKAR